MNDVFDPSSGKFVKKEIGAKQDKGKREWWLFALLWKPLEQVVLVLEHGRDKYSIRGECTCGYASAGNQYKLEDSVIVITTGGSSKRTPDIESVSLKTRSAGELNIPIGRKRSKSVGEKKIAQTRRPNAEKLIKRFVESMGYRLKNETRFLQKVAKSAGAKSAFTSIIFEERESIEGAFATTATSGSGLLNAPKNGLSGHSPTCGVHEVIRSGAHNWQHVKDPDGSPARLRYSDALQRHLIDHWEGVKTDEDSGLPVLAHLVCDALFVLWFDLKAQSEAESPARKGAKR
jgi:hypothetical protein